MFLASRGLAVRGDRPGEDRSRDRRGGGTMARGDRKAALRARIGLEGLEGRNLQSSLVGGAAVSAPLLRPTAASAATYDTTVWGRPDVGLGTAAEEDGFAQIKGDSA